MKRIKLLFLFMALSTTGISAQYYANYSNYNREDFRINRQELRDFEYELEHFSYAMMTNNLREARYAKRQIERDMEREIQQTRRALRRFNSFNNNNGYSKRSNNNGSLRLQSRNNGARQRGVRVVNEYSQLVHQLEKQERLFYRFSELRLTNRRRNIINENEHRRIMYRFAESMREELLEDRIERTNPRRGR